LSYSINNRSWTSWHSYLPNFFITSKDALYSGSDSTIWKHNQIGSYGNFYGVQYQFIVERVAIVNPLMDNTYEDMTIQTDAREWDSITKDFINRRLVTFNKILLYNNSQSSKELLLVVKQTEASPANWYSNQIKVTNGSILISKEGENWNLNAFRDQVADYNKSLFSSNWEDIKDKYFIDKIVNANVVATRKQWYERKTFSGKFVVIRLIFDNFNGINLGLNYSIDTQQVSE
jgi:hypothetical protein